MDPIENAVGALGKWQIMVSLLIFLSRFPVAFLHMAIIFIAPPVSYDCITPRNSSACAPECKEVQFDHSIFEETITTEWKLICNKEHLANLSQTISMLGILLGNLLISMWADRIGRRFPLVLCVVAQLVTGVAASFVPWFWLFCLLKFLCAFTTGGIMTTSFVLLMEIIGINRRAIMSVLFQLPFNIGHLILPAYGYFLRQWRWFQFAISFTSIIMLPYWCLLPESPRWLLLRGRTAEAAEILKKGARMNGLPDENIEADLIKESKNKKSSNVKPVAKGTIIDLFRTPPLALETVIVCFVWFSFGLYFYGCAQYMGHISGNIFGNVAFGAACTIPATLISIPALQYCGRKLYLIISNSISGIAMLIIACISPDNEVPVIVLSSIGMLGMAATLCNVYLYTGELYPTVVRNIAVGIAAMTARIGSMIAPFVVGLKKTEHYLPPIIFAAATLIGAVMVIWLPETRNRPLGETIDDSKQLLASTDKFKFSNVSSNLNKV